MLERRPRRAEVVLLTHEFAIGLPPVLRDGYRHFLRAARLRRLDLHQDLTNRLRGLQRQHQRLFTRLWAIQRLAPAPRPPSNAEATGSRASPQLTRTVA